MTYEYYSPPMSYDEIVATQGEILKDWVMGDWQGDYIYLLKKDDKYSAVVIGYGSCSGCDALQACDNDEDFEALKQDVLRTIVWVTKEDILNDLDDEELNRWYFHEEDWEDIKKEIKEILA